MDPTGNNFDVWLVGPGGAHRDFRDALALLHAGARVTIIPDIATADSTTINPPPALLVIVQRRPGEVRLSDIDRLRRRIPLAGVVSLLGSWCEGESRTGRPVPGALRLYWHEFPTWWRWQMSLLDPDPVASRVVLDPGRGGGPPGAPIRDPKSDIRDRNTGLIVMNTPRCDTADALSDALRTAGYTTLWQPPGRSPPQFRGAAAGIWEGGQLDDREAEQLTEFCRRMARDGAPVVTLLDFPRLHRTERAFQLGAKAVLGKPWVNVELVATIEDIAIGKNPVSLPDGACAA